MTARLAFIPDEVCPMHVSPHDLFHVPCSPVQGLPVVNLLLLRGANPDRGDPHDPNDQKEYTPLRHACMRGFAHIAGRLISSGARTDDPQPLLYAVRSGHVNVVQRLLAGGFSPDGSGVLVIPGRNGLNEMQGLTPVFVAGMDGNPGMVRALLAAGATPGPGAMCMAAQVGSLPCIRLLIVAIPTLVNTPYRGLYPLHYAALTGQVPAIRTLASSGANLQQRSLNVQTIGNMLPRQVARHYRQQQAMDTIIQLGG